jgi:hypothetical protein
MRLSDAKLIRKIFEVSEPRRMRACDWHPAQRKNLDVSVPDLSDTDAGYPRDHDDDDYTERLSDDADRDDADDQQQKDKAMKDPMRRLKSLDAVSICKTMSNEGSAFGLAEHDLVALIDSYAKKHGTSFAKLFEAQDDTGLALRKAVTIARDAQFLSRTSKAAGMPGRATLTPRSSGFPGKPAQQNVNNPKSALAALQELVDAQRAANPALSESEAWLRVYEHPDNRELALRERAENRPVATAW